MWLFHGVSSAPQSRHEASKTGAECFPAWLLKHLPQCRRTRQHCCLSEVVDALVPERQGAEAEVCQPHGLGLCPPLCSLCVLSKRREEACSLRWWDAFEEGSRRNGTMGKWWAFLSDVSDVHAVVLVWVCSGEKVPSEIGNYPISRFPKAGISLAKKYIVTNLRLIWHFAGMGWKWRCLSGQAGTGFWSSFCSLWRVLTFFKQKWY